MNSSSAALRAAPLVSSSQPVYTSQRPQAADPSLRQLALRPVITNKIAQTVTQLVLQSYLPASTPDFLPQLLSLLRTHPPGSPSTSVSPAPLNAQSTDLLLEVLHELSLSLGSDVTLRVAKNREAMMRDTTVKDAIRASHAGLIAENIWKTFEECVVKLEGVDPSSVHAAVAHSGQRSLTPSSAANLLRKTAYVAGDYASWLDIGLMVTPDTVRLLMNLLHHPVPALRTAAADAVLQVVTKGMKAPDKLELLKVLDLTSVISRLEYQTRTAGTHQQMRELGMVASDAGSNGFVDNTGSASSSVAARENVEFRERIARLADGVAMELGRIIEETSSAETSNVRANASQLLDAHTDLVLAFLADEDDGPAEMVLPCIQMVLNAYKKVKRKTEEAQLSAQQSQFLRNLTTVTLTKMRYDSDAEWKGLGSEDDDEEEDLDDEEEDDDEAAFSQLRKKLQMILASVAGLDEALYSSATQSVIFGTLSRFEQASNGNGAAPTWQEMEMALFATYFFGEILIQASAGGKTGLTAVAFVNTAELSTKQIEGNRKLLNRLDQDTLRGLPLSALGETISRLVASSVPSFPHTAVQVQFFECLVRYTAFFTARSSSLQQALVPFLDQRGIHHSKRSVRQRINYLFSRFVRETKQQIPQDFIGTILQSISDVLVVRARLPEVSEGEDPLIKATERAGAFDSQLHLFDLCGILLANLNSSPAQQAELFPPIVGPLSSGLQDAVQRFEASGRSDTVQVLQAHHLILAMSNLAKGFPDASNIPSDDINQGPTWITVFKSITEQIMSAVSSLRQFYIIRDAGRGAFARIVSTIGRAALPFVPTLLDAILSEMTSAELVDSINFLCLIIHKYKDDLRNIMDQLFLVLVERIFFFLNQPATGTDDQLQKLAMQKAYISFIQSLFQSNLDGLLLSDQNQPRLQNILESLVYCASDLSDKPSSKQAIGALGGIVFQWGSSLPGFDTFMYETLVPLVFETPAKPELDLQDAQTQQVIGELASLVKKIYATRSEELLAYLLNVYFPRIGAPTEVAEGMANGLKTLDVKAYRRTLIEFATMIRSSSS